MDDGYLSDIRYANLTIDRAVAASVIELAIEIAREGREGRKIGTIFVIGDEGRVLEQSRCLILDPLAGHPREALDITDPNARETVKELAQLDGGFVVSADGHVISASRYFTASIDDLEFMLGLGTRHIAGASISKHTDALAVVVSESSVVRLFEGGRLTAEILPEVWLLNRFSSHMPHPRLAAHPAENIAVVSEE